MTVRSHFIFWSVAIAAFLGFVFIFKSVLTPFVLGIAIAYLLNPLVNRMGNAGLPRGPAALVILSVFIMIVVAFFSALTPILYKEVLELSADLPSYLDKLWVLVEPLSHNIRTMIGQENGEEFRTLIGQHAGTALNVTKGVLGGLAAGGQAALGTLSILVITPVVAYFMMKEWPHITSWVTDLMPRSQKDVIMGLLQDIDQKLSGFVRGQISVAFILGIGYAIALSLIGLKYGFLIGLSAGLLSIIPMVGSAIGLVVSVGVACFQWIPDGDWIFIAAVAGIFIGGQIIEGNFLTPKLVGGSVGMHPLWVFFAILAGGSLFGIVGMLLARARGRRGRGADRVCDQAI